MSEPPLTPTPDRLVQIVDAARDLLERDGPDGLTMRRLAERLGMRAPSLYKHVADKEELEVLLIAQALREQGSRMHASVAGLPRRGSRKVALAALARAYRAWALAHPHLYRLGDRGAIAAGAAARRARGLGGPAGRSDRRNGGEGAGHVGVRARHDDPRARRPVPTGRRSRRGMGFSALPRSPDAGFARRALSVQRSPTRVVDGGRPRLPSRKESSWTSTRTSH